MRSTKAELLLLRTLHRRENQTYVVLFKGESSDSFYLEGDHFLIFFYIFSSLVTHYPFAIVTWWCEFPKNEYYLAYFHLEMAFKLLNTLILLPLRLWFLTCIYREGDSYDMRKKLPFCVGLLLRLLRKNLRVFVTCTSGFDRAPACVIAYLHWFQEVHFGLFD